MDIEQINLSAINSRVIVGTQSDRHVFFGVDNKFISHALITVMSIIEHADGNAYHFHIISSDLREDDEEKYTKILVGTVHGLTLHLAGNDLFSSFPTTALFTRATYYRLLAPLLMQGADKVLYLDADMVCIRSPAELWSLSTGEQKIALVVGESEKLQPELAADVGLKNARYFNAGMMLIDVGQWNAARISENAVRLLTCPGKSLKYLDQDALNVILEGRVGYINRKFNQIEMLTHDERGYKTEVPQDTCIIHFAGADKPWQEWNQQNICHYYRNIYRRSPVADQPFDLPQTHQQAKKMYKTLFRSHQFLKGVYWRLRYYKMRHL